MALSRESLGLIVDLIENKLSCMQVSDRDDLREAALLQRCLSELHSMSALEAGVLSEFASVPRRGRRRKLMRA